jgi:uncharacterized protein YkwD
MSFLRCWLFTLPLFAGVGLGGAVGQDKKDQPELKLSKDEQALVDLVNQAREKEKLPPLKPHALLFQAARGHSENMAKQGKLSHNLDDKKASDRVAATGYKAVSAGEAIGGGNKLTPQGTIAGWMNSPSHKAIILDKQYEDIGIGIAKDAKGAVYYTLVAGVALKDGKGPPKDPAK